MCSSCRHEIFANWCASYAYTRAFVCMTPVQVTSLYCDRGILGYVADYGDVVELVDPSKHDRSANKVCMRAYVKA